MIGLSFSAIRRFQNEIQVTKGLVSQKRKFQAFKMDLEL